MGARVVHVLLTAFACIALQVPQGARLPLPQEREDKPLAELPRVRALPSFIHQICLKYTAILHLKAVDALRTL